MADMCVVVIVLEMDEVLYTKKERNNLVWSAKTLVMACALEEVSTWILSSSKSPHLLVQPPDIRLLQRVYK